MMMIYLRVPKAPDSDRRPVLNCGPYVDWNDDDDTKADAHMSLMA